MEAGSGRKGNSSADKATLLVLPPTTAAVDIDERDGDDELLFIVFAVQTLVVLQFSSPQPEMIQSE